MRRLMPVPALAALILVTGAFAVRPTAADPVLITAPLLPVGGSGVTGQVVLAQLPQPTGGTDITITATGLTPGQGYLSLYYDNHTCRLEPYSQDDVIATFTALPGGVAIAHGRVDDDLDEINSVSIRRASDFRLVACADIHPGR